MGTAPRRPVKLKGPLRQSEATAHHRDVVLEGFWAPRPPAERRVIMDPNRFGFESMVELEPYRI